MGLTLNVKGNVTIEQYIETQHVGTQYVGKQYTENQTIENRGSNLPAVLNTPRAKEIWDIVKKKEWIDDNYQPSASLSRDAIVLLADRIGTVLNLARSKRWAPFEQLWGINNMRSRYDHAMSAEAIRPFFEELFTTIR